MESARASGCSHHFPPCWTRSLRQTTEHTGVQTDTPLASYNIDFDKNVIQANALDYTDHKTQECKNNDLQKHIHISDFLMHWCHTLSPSALFPDITFELWSCFTLSCLIRTVIE